MSRAVSIAAIKVDVAVRGVTAIVVHTGSVGIKARHCGFTRCRPTGGDTAGLIALIGDSDSKFAGASALVIGDTGVSNRRFCGQVIVIYAVWNAFIDLTVAIVILTIAHFIRWGATGPAGIEAKTIVATIVTA